MADRYSLMAAYARSDVARGRAMAGLFVWAASVLKQPASGDDAIRLRLFAERLPLQPDLYSSRIVGYLLLEPAILATLEEQIAADLDETQADRMRGALDEAIPGAVSRLARIEISQSDIGAWRRA